MEYSTELMCFSFSCSHIGEDKTKLLKYSNKILLPSSVLSTLNDEDVMETPFVFRIKNKETQYGMVCGVHEFTAPPGVIHISYGLMAQMNVNEGDTVTIELVQPPKGDYIKIKPHQTEFIELHNPKAILEKHMSENYPVITKGQAISIKYEATGKVYYIDIVETGPSEVILTLNCDLNVDFDEPYDYQEVMAERKKKKEEEEHKRQESEMRSMRNEKIKQHKQNLGFVPFSGKGNILGSK
jgi:hypothetical protein